MARYVVTARSDAPPEGGVAALFAWLFGHGSYSGSFQGELEVFAALAGAEARRTSDQGGAPA